MCHVDVVFYFVAAGCVFSFISMLLGGGYIVSWIAYHLIEIVSDLSIFGKCLLHYARDPEGRYRAVQLARQERRKKS